MIYQRRLSEVPKPRRSLPQNKKGRENAASLKGGNIGGEPNIIFYVGTSSDFTIHMQANNTLNTLNKVTVLSSYPV